MAGDPDPVGPVAVMSAYLGYRLCDWLSNQLPPRLAFASAERLADCWAASATGPRSAVRSNLAAIRHAAPAASHVREVFRNFGRYLVEFFTIHRTPKPAIAIDGLRHLEEAKRSPSGIIVLTGHLGNWEVGAVALKRMGLPVSVIALPHQDPRMNRLFNSQRARCGLEVIPLGSGAAMSGLRSLRHGRLLGMLADRDFTSDGAELLLFGHHARIPTGPAVLSLRSRAPVLPTFLVREGRWKFRLCFEPPIWPDAAATTGSAADALTRRYAAVLERYVRQLPEQWLIFKPLAAAP
jgi:KDO2-lipid IV(A) lauroyltransferase